jgi:hypothetical protein
MLNGFFVPDPSAQECRLIVVPSHKDTEAILKYLYAKYPDLRDYGSISLQRTTCSLLKRIPRRLRSVEDELALCKSPLVEGPLAPP